MKEKSVNPLLLVALGVLALAGAWFVAVRPQSARLADARDTRTAVEQQLSVARQQAAAPPTTVASDGPDPVQLAVPAEADLPSVLRQLDGIARETGIVHSSVNPSPVAATPGVSGGSVQLTIAATGSRAGAYAYLNRLALLPRLVVVEQLGLGEGTGAGAGSAAAAAPTSGEANGTVNLQLLARVFTTQPPATSAS